MRRLMPMSRGARFGRTGVTSRAFRDIKVSRRVEETNVVHGKFSVEYTLGPR